MIDTGVGKPFVALVDNHHQANDGDSVWTLKREYSIIQLNDVCNGNASRQYLTSIMSGVKANRKSVGDKKDSRQTSIYEIQSLPHSKSEEYSSFFVGSRVISNPSLHLINRVDPLYLLLSYFESEVNIALGGGMTVERKWQPWNQLCQSKNINPTVQKVLNQNKLQLKHFFQVNESLVSNDSDNDEDDSGDDDFILFKFSPDKVLKWLQCKVKSVESILEKQLKSRRYHEKQAKEESERSHKQNGGAFSSSFVLSSKNSSLSKDPMKDSTVTPKKRPELVEHDDDENSNAMNEIVLTEEDQQTLLRSSIQMVCEYISPSWQKKLIQLFNLNMTDVFESSSKATLSTTKDELSDIKSPETKSQCKPTTVTPTYALSEAEKLLQYTTGNGSGSDMGKDNISEDEIKKKRKIQGAQSVGLKKLQKVNTKGMKSLSSFFSPASKKKKSK